MADIQSFLDGMSAAMRLHRIRTQMTLGQMIASLESFGANREVGGLFRPHSYRGYYEDLAFEPGVGKMLVSELLGMCHECVGRVYEGYKGGEYRMTEDTPVWISEYGTTGVKIIAIDADGEWITKDDD